MRIIIVGPGRAGGAIATAAHAGGEDIVGVFARRSDDQIVAKHVSLVARPIGSALPEADLLIVSVRDDALFDVASVIAPVAGNVPFAVHLSGLVSTAVLDPLRDRGIEVGSFHPLQTIPDWESGAAALNGAHVAVTAGEELAGVLDGLAMSLGARVFNIEDDAKPLYHAAAAASANYVIAALAVGEELFNAAGVDEAVARPLVEEVVSNAFDRGARAALTGPIARGDVGTVASQLEAVAAAAPHLLHTFKAFGRATAVLAGTDDLMDELLL